MVTALSSIELVSGLRQQLQLAVSVKDIFNLRTIERLSQQLEKKTPQSMGSIQSESGSLQGDVPLLPIQRWFFAQQFVAPERADQTFLYCILQTWMWSDCGHVFIH